LAHGLLQKVDIHFLIIYWSLLMSAFSRIRHGSWEIQSVIVNAETVMNDEGFRRLEFGNNEMLIQPVGFRFQLSESHDNNIVFISRGQIFNAQITLEGEDVQLELTRPKFDERITIEARYVPALVFSNN
jgi:hypothetical protein